MQATTTAPLFAAELTPHRSLTPRGMRLVVLLVAALAAFPGVIFFLLGAWPVVGFMGLDVLAIALALYVAMRREKRREQLTLWSDRLELVTTDAKGAQARTQLVPRTVRLVIDRDFNERTTALKLRTAKGETEIGAFLTQDDKASLAKAFGTALRKARA
ncbi:DUF2244 domain-containing protein [uncultured Devosia sp.]|uniref:DUF2244 domain-containing protein n=1 Tax=uncultured Devosia sp. TaxID=211434 RepID=UPI0035CB3B1B